MQPAFAECDPDAVTTHAAVRQTRVHTVGQRRRIHRCQDHALAGRCCNRSLFDSLCVRHKLTAKEPLYATQTQGRSDG
ncbi:hypothetical protein BFF94_037555 [Burkholderia catarinensis]|nr:hypothetical protein BFF94_037555 [Burkholderia catarinensis]